MPAHFSAISFLHIQVWGLKHSNRNIWRTS